MGSQTPPPGGDDETPVPRFLGLFCPIWTRAKEPSKKGQKSTFLRGDRNPPKPLKMAKNACFGTPFAQNWTFEPFPCPLSPQIAKMAEKA